MCDNDGRTISGQSAKVVLNVLRMALQSAARLGQAVLRMDKMDVLCRTCKLCLSDPP